MCLLWRSFLRNNRLAGQDRKIKVCLGARTEPTCCGRGEIGKRMGLKTPRPPGLAGSSPAVRTKPQTSVPILMCDMLGMRLEYPATGMLQSGVETERAAVPATPETPGTCPEAVAEARDPVELRHPAPSARPARRPSASPAWAVRSRRPVALRPEARSWCRPSRRHSQLRLRP